MWKATSESYGKRRRVYEKERGDTDAELAGRLGLNVNEKGKWMKKAGKCKVSVPNVYIAADLLRGGCLWERFINLGGTIGQFVGTDLLRYGYHFSKPRTLDELVGDLIRFRGDLYGVTVYAHGGKDGSIFEGNQINGTLQRNLMNAVRLNGYKPAVAWLMQCYSIYKDKQVDFWDDWQQIVKDPHGYHGQNFMGIDLYYW